jgi:hypothetical protein
LLAELAIAAAERQDYLQGLGLHRRMRPRFLCMIGSERVCIAGKTIAAILPFPVLFAFLGMAERSYF